MPSCSTHNMEKSLIIFVGSLVFLILMLIFLSLNHLGEHFCMLFIVSFTFSSSRVFLRLLVSPCTAVQYITYVRVCLCVSKVSMNIQYSKTSGSVSFLLCPFSSALETYTNPRGREQMCTWKCRSTKSCIISLRKKDANSGREAKKCKFVPSKLCLLYMSQRKAISYRRNITKYSP